MHAGNLNLVQQTSLGHFGLVALHLNFSQHFFFINMVFCNCSLIKQEIFLFSCFLIYVILTSYTLFIPFSCVIICATCIPGVCVFAWNTSAEVKAGLGQLLVLHFNKFSPHSILRRSLPCISAFNKHIFSRCTFCPTKSCGNDDGRWRRWWWLWWWWWWR